MGGGEGWTDTHIKDVNIMYGSHKNVVFIIFFYNNYFVVFNLHPTPTPIKYNYFTEFK